MAGYEFSAGDYAAGSAALVGYDPTDDRRAVVRDPETLAKLGAGAGIQPDAYSGVFDISGKRRDGLSPANADTGFSIYFYSCGLGIVQGK